MAGLATANAQVYPVQATTQLIAPYSLYLSDYASPTSDRIIFTAFLNDVSHADIQVRLKLHIEGQGIILETKQEFVPSPLVLQSGIPLRLVSADLTQYFEPQNLNFQGMTRREYEQRGKLPEGIYQFSFEVLEYNRGVKISNTGMAMAWMILNDPPIINLPRQQDKIKPISPQNVVFQWTPRHTGSPNSAFTTEYELTIVEVWPGDRNPNDAILTSLPIYQNTTQSTTVIYGPAETPLELGRRYAFRVKAKSIVGVDELDLFKNNGYSEVFTFVYGDACMSPTDVSATAGSNRLALQWTGQSNHTGFNVRYREQGTQNWYTNQTSITESNIYSLKPSTVYEYEVGGTCGFFDGVYTDVATIKTQAEQSLSYSCGAPSDKVTIDPSTLLGSLKTGDVVKAGDFDVEVTKATGGSGIFSGEGIIPLSYFKKAKAKVEFTNIKVNKDLQLVDGFMNVTGAGVDIIPAGVLNLVDKLDQALDIADSALSLVESMIPDDVPNPSSFVADTLVHINGDILAVVKNPVSGKVIVTTTTGQVKELEPGTSYAVTDSKGKGYMVDKNGNVGKTTADLAAKTAKREYNLSVAFERAMSTKLGFDRKLKDGPYKAVQGYEEIEGGYSVAWKALATGQPDGVRAVVSKSAPDKSKIRYELNGQPLSATPYVGDSTNLSLLGSIAGDQQDLIAIVDAPDTTKKAQVLGKLRTMTYDGITKNLIIVPVNGTQYPGAISKLSTDLNKIYAQAAVNWTVSLYSENGGNLKVDGLPVPFDDGNSGIASNYTGDMKQVINAFGGNFAPDTYYLFLVNKPASGKTLGYMPRSKQAGFIFVDMHGGNENALITTIGHELGHGAFTLKHTFDKDDLNISEGNTKDNLMDYTKGVGRRLIKGQWDRIHMPVTVLGLFENDADGQYGSSGIRQLPSILLNNDNKTFTFLTPFGEYITLPSTVKNPRFFHGYSSISEAESNKYIVGSLVGFSIDGVEYNCAGTGGLSFIGSDKNNKTVFPDAFIGKTLPDFVILAINLGKGLSIGKYKFDKSIPVYGTRLNPLSEEQDIDGNLFLAAKQVASLEINGLFEGQYYVTEEESRMVANHKDRATILLVNKIAQIRNMYPALFDEFTSAWDQWVVTPMTSPGVGIWDLKLYKNNDLLKKWLNGSDANRLVYYKQFLTELIQYMSQQSLEMQLMLTEMSEQTPSDDVFKLLSKLSDEDYQSLTVQQRILILRIIANHWITGSEEDHVLKLFTTVNEIEDRFILLEALVENKDVDQEKYLLPDLVNGLDNPQFSQFVSLITQWINDRESIKAHFGLVDLDPKKKRKIDFSDSFFDSSSESFDDNGKINLKTKVRTFIVIPTAQGVSFSWITNETNALGVEPFDPITITFSIDYTIGKEVYKAGSTIVVPAITAYMLFNNANSSRIDTGIKIVRVGIDVLIIVTSAGSLGPAVAAWEGGASMATGWALATTMFDLGLSAIDIRMVFAESDLLQSEEGKALLHQWNLINSIYWLGRGAESVVNSAAEISKFSTLIQNAIKSGKLGNLVIDAERAAQLRSVLGEFTKPGNGGGSPGLIDLLGLYGNEMYKSLDNGGALLTTGPKNYTPGGGTVAVREISIAPEISAALRESQMLDLQVAAGVAKDLVKVNILLTNAAVMREAKKAFEIVKLLDFGTKISLASCYLAASEGPVTEESTKLAMKQAVEPGRLEVLVSNDGQSKVLVFTSESGQYVVASSGEIATKIEEVSKTDDKEEEDANCNLCPGRAKKGDGLCDRVNVVASKSQDRSTTSTALNTMCTQISQTSTLNGALSKMITFNGTQIAIFSNDVNNTSQDVESLNRHVSDVTSSLLDSWKYFNTNSKTINQAYYPSLSRFPRLNSTVQDYVINFTDQTLKEFTKDLDADSNVPEKNSLTKYLNNHPDIAKGFVGHKDLIETSYDFLRETVRGHSNDITQDLYAKIEEWLDYSEGVSKKKKYFKLGNEFEEYIKSQLSNSSSQVWQAVDQKIQELSQDKNGTPTDGLSKYTIYYQSYLCINQLEVCTGEGSYFKPDFLLIKEENGVFKCVVLDTKLSSDTQFTDNQKAAMTLGSYWVRVGGEAIYNEAQSIKVVKRDVPFLKIYSNGSGLFGGIK